MRPAVLMNGTTSMTSGPQRHVSTRAVTRCGARWVRHRRRGPVAVHVLHVPLDLLEVALIRVGARHNRNLR
jgi:hypothetical protein